MPQVPSRSPALNFPAVQPIWRTPRRLADPGAALEDDVRVHRILFSAVIAIASLGAVASAGAAGEQILPWTPQTWAEVAKLPDWSGVWVPDVRDQDARIKTDPTPWNPAAAKKIEDMNAQEDAGDPKGLFYDCLPEAMPSWMLITHNAIEFTFTPGRVTMLGEADGNRLRRVYTDGRPHPDDPDLTFHGHSIGHWEGQTLVIDTVGILPQALIALTEAAGVPNNGDMHIVEHVHLTGPDTLQDDLEITAPHVLTRTWKTSRIYYRHRERVGDIVEGVCLQGGMSAKTDDKGDAVFVPLPHSHGIPVAPGGQ